MSTANPFTYAGSITNIPEGSALHGTVPSNLIGFGFNGLPVNMHGTLPDVSPSSNAAALDVTGYDVINAYSADQLTNIFFNLKDIGLNTRLEIEFLSNSTNTSDISLNPSGVVPTTLREPRDRRISGGISGNLTSHRASLNLNNLHPLNVDDDGDGVTDRPAFANLDIFYESSASFDISSPKILVNNGSFVGYGYEEIAHALAIIAVEGGPSGHAFYQYQYTGIFGNLDDESGITPLTNEIHSSTVVGSNSADTDGPTVTRGNTTIGGITFRIIRITHSFNQYASGSTTLLDVATGLADIPIATASIGSSSFYTYA